MLSNQKEKQPSIDWILFLFSSSMTSEKRGEETQKKLHFIAFIDTDFSLILQREKKTHSFLANKPVRKFE